MARIKRWDLAISFSIIYKFDFALRQSHWCWWEICFHSIKFRRVLPPKSRKTRAKFKLWDKKDRLILGLFLKYVESFANTKTRISNLLLSIKFTRSLSPKVAENVKQIRSLAKKEIFALTLLKYALCVTRQSLKYQYLPN